MTANAPGHSSATPLSRRQLRELERRRALEESGQDPDASSVEEHPEPAAPGREEPGYEEFTRELKLDQMLPRRELRALYEARRATASAGAMLTHPMDVEGGRPEAEHDGVLLQSVPSNGPEIPTSSLVLQTPGHHHDLQHALDSSGEIIVTGTIDLPRSLSMTGAHPDRYDSVEIDRILDAADAVDQVESDAAPVPASRAVSTSTQTRDVVTMPSRLRPSLSVVLASTGGVLFVGVGALLVVALGLR